MEFYEQIIKDANLYLKKGGYIAFELGLGEADDVRKLLQKYGFENIEIEKDLAYIERVITGRLK